MHYYQLEIFLFFVRAACEVRYVDELRPKTPVAVAILTSFCAYYYKHNLITKSGIYTDVLTISSDCSNIGDIYSLG